MPGSFITNSEQVGTGESRQAPSLFLNRGDGRFDQLPVAPKALCGGAAFGDFNLDGKLDVVITRLNEAPLLLTNLTSTPNHWLRIRLRGHQSTRDGIGARIHVVTDLASQWNQVTTSLGYAGSSEPEVHFGLGRSTLVRTLEIWWPSGARQILRDQRATVGCRSTSRTNLKRN